MTQITQFKCNHCENNFFDYIIQISGRKLFIKSFGNILMDSSSEKELHFCSLPCLNLWLKKEITESDSQNMVAEKV